VLHLATNTTRFAIPLILAALLMGGACSVAQPPNQVYDDIKALEGQFPLPTPLATLDVCRFHLPIGHCEMLVGERMRPSQIYKNVMVNGLDARLVFHVVGMDAGETYRVRVWNPEAGLDISRTTQGASLTIDVGRVPFVICDMDAQGKDYHCSLFFEHPPVIGAGVFTIPAVPVAIVYEPPQDRNKRNTAAYEQTTSIGTRVSMSFMEEESTTRPASSEFSDLMGFRSLVGLASSAASAAGYGTVGNVLGAIRSGLGQVTATETRGTTATTEHELAITDAVTDSYGTGAHLGPGRGDRVVLLKNARLVWLARDGTLTLSVMGYDTVSSLGMELLKQNANSGVAGLAPDTVQALLALDPFVRHGGGARLAEPRYVFVEHYEVNAGHDRHVFRRTITQADLEATTEFTSRTVDYRAGWLSFFGLGVTENKTVMTKMTQGGSSQLSVGTQVASAVDLYAEADELYGVYAYYDRVFGTFAFKSDRLQLRPVVIAGVLKATTGLPLANQLVTVSVRGMKFTTRTDKQGRYSFHSAAIPSGRARVTARDAQQLVTIRKGAPAANVTLRSPARAKVTPRARPGVRRLPPLRR